MKKIIIMAAFVLIALFSSYTHASGVDRSLSGSVIDADSELTVTLTIVDPPENYSVLITESIPANWLYNGNHKQGDSVVLTLTNNDSSSFNYTLKAPSSAGNSTFMGTYQFQGGNSGDITGSNIVEVLSSKVCNDGETKPCGNDSCSGEETCVSGQWNGICSSEGQHCALCSKCSSTGICDILDNSQEATECVNNSISQIAGECTSNSNSNLYIWRYRDAFSSVCDAPLKCSIGNNAIIDTCNKNNCPGSCESSTDCVCQNQSGCFDSDGDGPDDYATYPLTGTCSSTSCSCDLTACQNPSIEIDSLKCDTCAHQWTLNQTLSDCNITDQQYQYYYDASNCTSGLAPAPVIHQCDRCTPAWSNISVNTTCQPGNIIIGYFQDNNQCFSITHLPADLVGQPANITYNNSCNYCEPDKQWSCTDWGDCKSSGLQRRTCSAISGCTITLPKPSEEIGCSYEAPSTGGGGGGGSSGGSSSGYIPPPIKPVNASKTGNSAQTSFQISSGNISFNDLPVTNNVSILSNSTEVYEQPAPKENPLSGDTKKISAFFSGIGTITGKVTGGSLGSKPFFIIPAFLLLIAAIFTIRKIKRRKKR